MKYTMVSPCDDCPFLVKMKHGFTQKRLVEFASGEFPCHKSATLNEADQFVEKDTSVHCAGALIFLEKRKKPHQMMRIAERLGMYDHAKLNMSAPVR